MDNRSTTTEQSLYHPYVTLIHQIVRFKTPIVVGLLILIYGLGFHLRYEDFPDWGTEGDGKAYLFQGQYQMTNFDSYYYLIAAKAIVNDQYSRSDDKRYIPDGATHSRIPPLSSWLAAKLSSWSGQPLHTIAIFFPVVLAPQLAFVIYLMAKSIGMNSGCRLFAAFLAVFSYTYVVRSRVGVFDTDCLNVTLLCLNCWLAVNVITNTGRLRPGLLTVLILTTALFSLWWNTAGLIPIFASIIPLGLAILFNMSGAARKRALAVVSLLSLLTLAIYHDSMIAILKVITGSNETAFPLLDSISELKPASLSDFVKNTAGHPILLLLMLTGLLLMVMKCPKQSLLFSLPILLAFSPLFIGNRFMIFSAPALALGGAFLIHFIWNRDFTIRQIDNRSAATILGLLIAGMTLVINYPRITQKLNIPAVHFNKPILERLSMLTEPNAKIWANWSIGYQIRYYLERGTYADGGLGNAGERLYYLSLPYATSNLRFAANFIQFYTHSDIHRLYPLFEDTPTALSFLKEALSQPPAKTGEKIEKLFKTQQLKSAEGLTSRDEWLRYLYPEPDTPIYLLLHERMIQTVSWFKQGNIDFEKRETIGLPLYKHFLNMEKKEIFIANNEIVLHTEKGLAKHNMGTPGAPQTIMHNLGSIKACEKERCKTSYFSKSNEKVPRFKAERDDDRNHFIWNSDLKIGAIVSKAMGNTAFVKMFLRTAPVDHFDLVRMETPYFQLWRVRGDRLTD